MSVCESVCQWLQMQSGRDYEVKCEFHFLAARSVYLSINSAIVWVDVFGIEGEMLNDSSQFFLCNFVVNG